MLTNYVVPCVLLYPVGCPVKRGKDISHNRICNFLRPNGCTQAKLVCLWKFMSLRHGMHMQVDGSL